MEEDPPDPDGVPCASHTVPKKNIPIEIEQTNRKRSQVSNNAVHPPKRLITDPSQPVPSIQSSYTHPDYIEKKIKYSNDDNAPFIVHVSKIVDDSSSGVVLKPIKFGHFLYHNNIKNVVSDGVKRVGRNRISVEFKSAADANHFIENPALAGAKYDTVIPSYNVTRMGIVRQVPVEWTLEELMSSIKVPAGFGTIIKARRFNRKLVNENQSTVWIPSQTVVLTFSGQKLPSNIYCFFTSMPVEPYILPLIQCHKCCCFGHVTSQCRSSSRCFVCAQNHEGISCTRQSPTCLFCSGAHTAKDPSCPEHSRQKSIKLIMSQENISYLEASARFPQVRRTYADTARSLPYNDNHNQSPISNSPLPSVVPSQSHSYRKTTFTPRLQPNPASSHGYDKFAHEAIIDTPSSSTTNGCALIGRSISPNDNLCELMISMLISMLSRFSDMDLPLALRQKLTELISLTNNLPSNTSVELPEH